MTILYTPSKGMEMATRLETALTMRAAAPRLYLNEYRINEVEEADSGRLAQLFRHHWEIGVADELDGLYHQLDRQEEAARLGNGWEFAKCLRNALQVPFVHRLIPSLYALRRLSEFHDLYDEVLALPVYVDAQINVALMLIDTIGRAVPARRRRYLSLRWFLQPLVEDIDRVLSTGIDDLCERAGVEAPSVRRRYH